MASERVIIAREKGMRKAQACLAPSRGRGNFQQEIIRDRIPYYQKIESSLSGFVFLI